MSRKRAPEETFRAVAKRRVELLGSSAFALRCKEESPDMLAHVPVLQEMNEHGYITFDSQDGTKNGPYLQRAYVSGFMQKKRAARFLKAMNMNTPMLCMLIPHAADIVHTERAMDLPLTVRGETVVTSMSSCVPHATHRVFLADAQVDRVPEELDHVFCMDLMWKRSVARKDGLFKTIVRVLKECG
jgi:hypothetical protein